LEADPQVAYDIGSYWRGLISRFGQRPNAEDTLGMTVAPWAALAMKECVQDTICSIWTHFCRTGIQRQRSEGLDRDELQAMVRGLADGSNLSLDGVPLALSPDELAPAVQARLLGAAAEFDWNTLRKWTADQDSASSGLAALLIFAGRAPDPGKVNPLWGEIARRGSTHQDGLLGIVSVLRRQLATGPSFGGLLEYVIRRFIIGPHEVVAYSKMPEATFRFSREGPLPRRPRTLRHVDQRTAPPSTGAGTRPRIARTTPSGDQLARSCG
jgi:hypothetical protein